jgi:phenylacetate-CoA ligase
MSIQTAVRSSDVFMFDPDVERMSRQSITALQTARLKQTLKNAYANVGCYRRKFEATGVRPDDFESIADITRFPFTLKSDLRDNYPFGMFAVPRDNLLRLHASSGTTGKPTVVGYSKGDLDLWSNLMARSLACAGAVPGDIVHNAYGYGLFTGGLGAHYGAERLGCTVVPVSGGATERQVTLLEDFGANVPPRRPTHSTSPKSQSVWASICDAHRCGSACSGQSHGATPCGAISSTGSGSRRWTSMACPRS